MAVFHPVNRVFGLFFGYLQRNGNCFVGPIAAPHNIEEADLILPVPLLLRSPRPAGQNASSA